MSENKEEDRASLVNRQLPEMTLSTAENPLTAPRPPPADLSAPQRAQYRFQVKGNAIITGGAGTLALEAAQALLEHGASGLALWDMNPDQAFESVKLLHAKFPDRRIITEVVDVRDEAQIASAIESTVKVLGSIDMLCCFAGVVGCTHAIDMAAAEWRRTHDINLTGSFLCAQAAARQMRVQGTGGCVVFTASISAHHTNYPQPQAAYNSSKTALLSLAKSLAAEWSSYGIRVNCLSPGYMDTILNFGPGLQRARDSWNSRNPMGRMGHPWELTGPLVTLCSNAGRYINGTDIIVDGGAMVF
ncbi:NAD(P)-binding protein [Dothidotthia symphoricarpi CBS 119687]|uniref:D-arabinitol 2-dehydrogenase [ribulose-forming] n=1 Tax=Dothidotthia symphoricarpi CBS 119687 TaxID=1392245 RepID=A0A6A6AEX5_9PLEO|nr:NAD(P)-binding protein [Dothidotthia symphoricarpi CBS 119687]KAF2130449.1 NAD(P)-binding protein [Dothidotthia symphoricarpi CBS 119687]